MEENIANSVDSTFENANANSQEVNQGTQENVNSTNATLENVAQVVDYQKKFSESSKEAQRLYEENKSLKEALELKGKSNEQFVHETTTDNLYPGFEELDEEARKNLLAYTEAVTNKAAEKLKKDPVYALAQKQYNEGVWDNAFSKISSKYPDLNKEEFKSKYFNVNNVPSNIEDLLDNAAKVHLFDKAKEIGMREAEKLNSRVELERNTSGPRDTSKTVRSLEEWNRMAQENPAKFSELRKEFQADMDSGKI